MSDVAAEGCIQALTGEKRQMKRKGTVMKKLEIVEPPVAHTAMLIRRQVPDVFEAIIDPEITPHFWFSKGSDRLAVGKRVQWDWEWYDISIEVTAKTIEPNKLIVMEWPGYSGPTTVTWKFMAFPCWLR
jgi:uncharacterized protein YndB with AHSA1/START domain